MPLDMGTNLIVREQKKSVIASNISAKGSVRNVQKSEVGFGRKSNRLAELIALHPCEDFFPHLCGIGLIGSTDWFSKSKSVVWFGYFWEWCSNVSGWFLLGGAIVALWFLFEILPAPTRPRDVAAPIDVGGQGVKREFISVWSLGWHLDSLSNVVLRRLVQNQGQWEIMAFSPLFTAVGFLLFLIVWFLHFLLLNLRKLLGLSLVATTVAVLVYSVTWQADIQWLGEWVSPVEWACVDRCFGATPDVLTLEYLNSVYHCGELCLKVRQEDPHLLVEYVEYVLKEQREHGDRVYCLVVRTWFIVFGLGYLGLFYYLGRDKAELARVQEELLGYLGNHHALVWVYVRVFLGSSDDLKSLVRVTAKLRDKFSWLPFVGLWSVGGLVWFWLSILLIGFVLAILMTLWTFPLFALGFRLVLGLGLLALLATRE